MDFTYINSCNLKISLTRDDLLKNELEAEKLDYSNVKTKKFIWELLDIANSKTGFDVGAERITVKVFPSPDGGCELFVTKKELSDMPKNSKGLICILDDTDKLYALCSRLRSAGYRGKSSLHTLDMQFVLVCTDCPRLPSYFKTKTETPSPDLYFASEYGNTIALDELSEAYIAEHCVKICDDAVQKITF